MRNKGPNCSLDSRPKLMRPTQGCPSWRSIILFGNFQQQREGFFLFFFLFLRGTSSRREVELPGSQERKKVDFHGAGAILSAKDHPGLDKRRRANGSPAKMQAALFTAAVGDVELLRPRNRVSVKRNAALSLVLDRALPCHRPGGGIGLSATRPRGGRCLGSSWPDHARQKFGFTRLYYNGLFPSRWPRH